MTSDWLDFEGVVEPLEGSRATYTILRIQPPIAERLAAVGARRVEGEIDDRPANLALSRAPLVDGWFLWAGWNLLDRLGAEPGKRVEVRLRPAPDDRVDLPDDLRAALGVADALSAWEALPPGRRRGRLYKLGTARTAATRAKRIADLVAERTGAPA